MTQLLLLLQSDVGGGIAAPAQNGQAGRDRPGSAQDGRLDNAATTPRADYAVPANPYRYAPCRAMLVAPGSPPYCAVRLCRYISCKALTCRRSPKPWQLRGLRVGMVKERVLPFPYMHAAGDSPGSIADKALNRGCRDVTLMVKASNALKSQGASSQHEASASSMQSAKSMGNLRSKPSWTRLQQDTLKAKRGATQHQSQGFNGLVQGTDR